MKIKTIKNRLDNVVSFDNDLNKALEEGYQLVHRGLVPGFRLDGGGYLHNMLYAELVLPDPAPEPETVHNFDPFQALRQVKQFCEAQKKCGECPLYNWCKLTDDYHDPTDWELPEVEV